MSKTNCINCGAAKDTSELKCPFCGTTYLDFTAIDFTSGEPVVCEFVLPYSKDRVVMRTIAVPRLNSIEIEPQYVTVDSGWGGFPLATFQVATDINIGIEFHPVARPGAKELFSISKDQSKDG